MSQMLIGCVYDIAESLNSHKYVVCSGKKQEITEV